MANTNIAPQGLFGPGILYVTRTDIANSGTHNVGFCNEFQYDLKGTIKDLMGQNQFPLLSAVGTKKATGKIKAAAMSLSVLNAVLLGGTATSAIEYALTTTTATAIPTTPFQITPTVPSSGTFDTDLGVINAATGEPLTLVASSPTAGQYSQAAGVYTFSSADNVSGVSVKISYAYHWTTGSTGQNIIVPNSLIGTTPTFQLDYYSILYGAGYYARFYNAICSGWTMAHKIEDFAMPEYDFSFFANSAQNIMLISSATTA